METRVPRARRAGIKKNFDLTKLARRRCVKCWRYDRRLDRHHKGHEYLFACLLPDKYLARYNEFRVEDVVDLCVKHHKSIHVIYKRRLGAWGFWTLLAKQDGKVTFVQAERFRKRLVNECHVWLRRGAGLRLKQELASSS